jgi:hypothetical protein
MYEKYSFGLIQLPLQSRCFYWHPGPIQMLSMADRLQIGRLDLRLNRSKAEKAVLFLTNAPGPTWHWARLVLKLNNL